MHKIFLKKENVMRLESKFQVLPSNALSDYKKLLAELKNAVDQSYDGAHSINAGFHQIMHELLTKNNEATTNGEKKLPDTSFSIHVACLALVLLPTIPDSHCESDSNLAHLKRLLNKDNKIDDNTSELALQRDRFAQLKSVCVMTYCHIEERLFPKKEAQATEHTTADVTINTLWALCASVQASTSRTLQHFFPALTDTDVRQVAADTGEFCVAMMQTTKEKVQNAIQAKIHSLLFPRGEQKRITEEPSNARARHIRYQ